MLPTFVIGLREGLEASLIVGIIAAFLVRRNRRDALRQVWLGVVVAVVICICIGVGLQVLSADLPQQRVWWRRDTFLASADPVTAFLGNVALVSIPS